MANTNSEVDDDIVCLPDDDNRSLLKRKSFLHYARCNRASKSWPLNHLGKSRYFSPESQAKTSSSEKLISKMTLAERKNSSHVDRTPDGNHSANKEPRSIIFHNGRYQRKLNFDMKHKFIKTEELKVSVSKSDESRNTIFSPLPPTTNLIQKKSSPGLVLSTAAFPVHHFRRHDLTITARSTGHESKRTEENRSPCQSQTKLLPEISSAGETRVLLGSLENAVGYCSKNQTTFSNSSLRLRQIKDSVTKAIEPECLVISSDDENEEAEEEEEAMYDIVDSLYNNDDDEEMMSQPNTPPSEDYDHMNADDVYSLQSRHKNEIERIAKAVETSFGPNIDAPRDSEEDEEDLDLRIMDTKDCNVDDFRPFVTAGCYCIRVGSYVVKTDYSHSTLDILADESGFQFDVPLLDCVGGKTSMCIGGEDIEQILVHFCEELNVMFIFPTQSCTRNICTQLSMDEESGIYIDSKGSDDTKKIITFLFHLLSDEQQKYLRSICETFAILKDVNLSVANEILVKSTPNVDLHQFQFPSPMSSPLKKAADIPQIKMTYPAEVGGIAITTDDYLRLDDNEFLNDVIIDFYLKYLMKEKMSEKDRQRTHIFNSFFFERLTQTVSEAPVDNLVKIVQRHSRVKSWTKNINIFEKDFIIVPINKDSHWFLAIICFPQLMPGYQSILRIVNKEHSELEHRLKSVNHLLELRKPNIVVNLPSFQTEAVADPASSQEHTKESISTSGSKTHLEQQSHTEKGAQFERMPCILIFDSIKSTYRRSVIKALREYLYIEWKVKTNSVCDFNTMPGHYLQVPRQTNFSDCGIYLLQYVESFFTDPIPYFSDVMPGLKNWFSIEKVSNKRNEIKELIIQLSKDC